MNVRISRTYTEISNAKARECDNFACTELRHKYPAYKSVSIRKGTFLESKGFLKRKAEEYTKSGFFYKGYDTNVLCFHCGLEVVAWDSMDPKAEHLRLSRSCKWLQSNLSLLPCQDNDSTDVNAQKTADTHSSKRDDNNTKIKREQSLDAVLSRRQSDKDEVARSLLCKVCFDRKFSETFLPCGHLSTCGECSLRLSKCPICRVHIVEKIRIYFP